MSLSPSAAATNMSLYMMLSVLRDDPTVDVPMVKKQHWTYHGDQGPDNWHIRYPKCAGRKQSPVNIRTNAVTYDTSLPDFRLTGFDQLSSSLAVGKSLTLTNTGHAAAVMVSGDMFVEGGGLPGRYRTAEFHFHWGSTSSVGSEHAIDGAKYCMEMHVVSYAEKYENLDNAKEKPDGLAVLAVLFEVSTQDNPDIVPLVDSAQYIHKAGDHHLLDGIRLRALLPADTSRYYRYSGSLTTPHCFETVTWTVFEERLKISDRQVSVMRHLLHENGHDPTVFTSRFFRTGVNTPTRILDNWRPLQALNSRSVKCSFPMTSHGPVALAPGYVTTTVQPPVVRGVCPGRKGYAIFGRHQPPMCVKYFPERVRFSEAQQCCRADGGHLVHVKTLAVWNTLNRFLISRTDGENVWVGAHDRSKDGHHYWTDGTRLARGDPVWDPDSQGESPLEDCVVMAAYVRLMEGYCANRNAFFCQVDM